MFIVTNFVDFYFHIIVPASTTLEINADRDKDQKDIRGKIGYIFISEHFEKFLVILAGTVSSLILMMFIAREICKLFQKFQMSKISVNYQFSML